MLFFYKLWPGFYRIQNLSKVILPQWEKLVWGQTELATENAQPFFYDHIFFYLFYSRKEKLYPLSLSSGLDVIFFGGIVNFQCLPKSVKEHLTLILNKKHVPSIHQLWYERSHWQMKSYRNLMQKCFLQKKKKQQEQNLIANIWITTVFLAQITQNESELANCIALKILPVSGNGSLFNSLDKRCLS